MILNNLKKIFQKNTVGLDIGSSSVKAVQVGDAEDEFIIQNIGSAKIKVNGEGRSAAVREAVLRLWNNCGIEEKNVGLGLSGSQAIVRYIEMPAMEKNELEKALPFEIQNYVPFDVDNALFTFQILETSGKKNNRKMKIIYGVSKKEVVDEIVERVEEIGLEPDFIDLDMFAAGQAVRKHSDDRRLLVVNSGASGTNINFLYNEGSLFAKDINWGGDSINRALQKHFNISYEEAEKIKIEGRMIEKKDGDELEIYSHITGVLEELTAELQKVLQYVTLKLDEQQPDSILLCGGMAELANLDVFIEKKLEIPVELYNPLRDYKISEEFKDSPELKRGGRYAVALGLALRNKL